jgi:phosphatidylglycerol---prolipoprotein diacylglyceryl transferase
MIWDASPVAFTLSVGTFQWPVYWYGLLFASALLYGMVIFRYMYRREWRPVDDVYDLTLYFMAGTVIGARLGHVLLYDPIYYLTHPLKILAIREGGMASHGAAIGVLLATWLYARKRPDQPYRWILDRMGLSVPISGFLIRIGNFFNSEILGKPTDMPWGVVFSRIDGIPRHPVQLYESLSYFVIFVILFRFYLKRGANPPPGYLLGWFFTLTFGVRFVLEYFKVEQASFETALSLTMGQWLSIPAVLLGLILLRLAQRSDRQGIGQTP